MELFSNDARAALNGSINNSVTSLTVTSALRFPATGNFALIVESELMLVTAVSGNVFTVTRGIEGTTAVAHASGVALAHMCSAGTIPRTFAAYNASGTLASLPAFGYTGRTYRTTDSPYAFYDNGSAWLPFESPILTLPPAAASWTWVNQKSAGLAATRSDTYGAVHLYGPTDTADSFSMLVKSIPSAPYSCIFNLAAFFPESNYTSFGVVWRNSANGNLKAMYQLYNSGAGSFLLGVGKATDGNPRVQTDYVAFVTRQMLRWFKLTDDNTNQVYSVSVDGFNWMPLYTHARNTDVTPNTVGFYVNPRNAIGASAMVSLMSYKEA